MSRRPTLTLRTHLQEGLNHEIKLQVFICFAGRVLAGAAGKTAINGQIAKTAPVYVISEAEVLTNADAIRDYGSKVQETLAPFKGHYHFVVAGGKVESLDGDGPPMGIVIIAFDNSEQAHAWYSFASLRSNSADPAGCGEGPHVHSGRRRTVATRQQTSRPPSHVN